MDPYEHTITCQFWTRTILMLALFWTLPVLQYETDNFSGGNFLFLQIFHIRYKIENNSKQKSDLFPNFEQCCDTFWYVYQNWPIQCSAVIMQSIFSKNPLIRHPISRPNAVSRPLGRGMGCLVCIQLLIYVLPQFLQWCMHYLVILYCIIMTLCHGRFWWELLAVILTNLGVISKTLMSS